VTAFLALPLGPAVTKAVVELAVTNCVVEEGCCVVKGLGFCVVGAGTMTVDLATPPSNLLKLNPTDSVAFIDLGFGWMRALSSLGLRFVLCAVFSVSPASSFVLWW